MGGEYRDSWVSQKGDPEPHIVQSGSWFGQHLNPDMDPKVWRTHGHLKSWLDQAHLKASSLLLWRWICNIQARFLPDQTFLLRVVLSSKDILRSLEKARGYSYSQELSGIPAGAEVDPKSFIILTVRLVWVSFLPAQDFMLSSFTADWKDDLKPSLWVGCPSLESSYIHNE